MELWLEASAAGQGQATSQTLRLTRPLEASANGQGVVTTARLSAVFYLPAALLMASAGRFYLNADAPLPSAEAAGGGIASAALTADLSLVASSTGESGIYAYLAEVKPEWLVITLPHNRSVFRHIDFGAIEYSDPSPDTSEEIDEIIVADQLYTDGNQIDFIRRNESWFVFGQVDTFPVHPYEMTMIRYDPVARTTHSVSRKFTIRREMVTDAQASLPRHALTMPLARNLFRRVNFGTINYTWPTPLASPLIDEIVIGNIEGSDQNQLDFILRYDGWFVSAQLASYPALPYEITFIHHDTAARKTYTAPALLTITRDVDPTK